MEGDIRGITPFLQIAHFNPLPPHGGRHNLMPSSISTTRFQSTPSAWRETDLFPTACIRLLDFNPLPPHGGRRNNSEHNNEHRKFQSTPSAWRETLSAMILDAHRPRISIHSLRMEGDLLRQIKYFVRFHISIHSLRMEGDFGYFLHWAWIDAISIHSLRMEGDWG